MTFGPVKIIVILDLSSFVKHLYNATKSESGSFKKVLIFFLVKMSKKKTF